jgi:hypothetical protein
MCSLKLPESLREPRSEDAVFTAIADVAERSFFAMVDPCDAGRFAALAAEQAEWLAATVRFDEASCAGAVTVRLPLSLAERLFDAFSGRDASEPAPPADDVRDLVGEFANMVCGSWLTHAANHRTFALSKPVVAVRTGDEAAREAQVGVLVAIDDVPCSVDMRSFPVAAMATKA